MPFVTDEHFNQKLIQQEERMVTYAEFVQNISKARELIGLASFKEVMLQVDGLIELLKKVGLLPLLRPFGILPSPEDFRTLIKQTSDNIYQVGLPQVLAYCVSCLEAYLKDQYCMINPFDNGQHNFQNVESIRETYGRVLKTDVFRGDESLASNLNSAFQRRHVIVHKARVIDEDACERAGWRLELVGTELQLDSTSVSSDIDVIEKFATGIYNKCVPKVT